MKALLLSIIITFLAISLSAQSFEKSVGIRLGKSNGIFFDKQNEDLSSYRFMMSWRDGGQHFTAMKIFRQYKLDKLPDYLSIYYGFGLHAGFVRWYEQTNKEEYGYYLQKRTAPIVGFDGIFGVSYDFTKAPFSLTCDVNPFIDLWGKKTYDFSTSRLSIGAVYSF